MEHLIQYFLLLSLLGFGVSLFINKTSEKTLSGVAMTTVGVHLLGFLAFLILWIQQGAQALNIQWIDIYKTKDFDFSLHFYFDTISAVYMTVASILTFLVIIFCKYYLHRDEGFKRLFNTILLFYFALNLIIFSGNFETIYVGWEIIGITSFLLITFYRDRFLPIKNGMKVLSVYRLGDVCFLLAIWLCHRLFHENVSFAEWNDISFLKEHLQQHSGLTFLISVLILIAAMIKSAQFPFSSWLPRAMEGPTTSSAIFYGSLSVHLGVFLLLRTSTFWDGMVWVKIVIGSIGLITAIVSSSIAHVQPTVKTQIAYASITQIGIIFIEIALGWHILALVHFAGNAFLRTYQLLVSPSVLSYMIHDQFFNFKAKEKKTYSAFVSKIRNTFYILSVKEWNLDAFQYKYLWSPFKWIGKQLDFLNNKIFIYILGFFFCAGVAFLKLNGRDGSLVFTILTASFGIIGVTLILKAFTERTDAKRAWTMITVSQLFIALTIALNENVAIEQIVLFLSGIVVFGVIGYITLVKITSQENNVSLNDFHGHIYEHPIYGIVFLISCLGLVGFPFTPTFLGVDLLFSHIHTNQIFLVILAAINFTFIELAAIRIYVRIFLGPHIKNYHEVAYKTS
jgi:NADH-quinone oxidoreductase subunit L